MLVREPRHRNDSQLRTISIFQKHILINLIKFLHKIKLLGMLKEIGKSNEEQIQLEVKNNLQMLHEQKDISATI